jgi:hypothetical protein
MHFAKEKEIYLPPVEARLTGEEARELSGLCWYRTSVPGVLAGVLFVALTPPTHPQSHGVLRPRRNTSAKPKPECAGRIESIAIS